MSQQPTLPEPAAPEIPPPSEPQPRTRAPWRLIPALALGVVLVIVPYTGSLVTLVPARIALADPQHKVALVATVALAGAIVGLLANILFGALSDLTRSRFGRRAPWLVIGGIGSGAMLLGLGHATSGGSIVLWWCLYQLFLNAVLAPLVAVIPDRVPPARMGVFSATYGAGVIVGGSVGIAIGGTLVLDTGSGFTIFAVLALASGLLFALLAGEPSSEHLERPAFSPSMLLHHFSFPRHGARDLYLALIGKLFQVIASYGLANFQLYLLTDYLHLDLAGAGAISARVSLLGFPLSIGLGIALGLVSDRIGRRKILVIGSALLAAIGVLFPFFVPTVAAFVAYALINSAAQGIYSSVDQALNNEVLPSTETAAKDLGIMNMATTGGMVLGPALCSVVVSAAGGYRELFLLAFVSLVVSAVLISTIRRVR